MGFASWIVLICIGVALFFAVRSLVRKRGGCAGCSDSDGCAGCPGAGACAGCMHATQNSEKTGLPNDPPEGSGGR